MYVRICLGQDSTRTSFFLFLHDYYLSYSFDMGYYQKYRTAFKTGQKQNCGQQNGLVLLRVEKKTVSEDQNRTIEYIKTRRPNIKLWRILRPGIAIRKKFKIRLLFGVENQGEAGIMVRLELNSNYYYKIWLLQFVLRVWSRYNLIIV